MKRMIYALLGFTLLAGTMLVGGSSAGAATAHSNGGAATSLSATAAPGTSYREPPPPCGYHFTLRRSGEDVRVAGVDLDAFGRGYKLVFAAAHGEGYGPFNATSYANFEIDTGSSSPTDISISLTNDENTRTLCASTYHE